MEFTNTVQSGANLDQGVQVATNNFRDSDIGEIGDDTVPSDSVIDMVTSNDNDNDRQVSWTVDRQDKLRQMVSEAQQKLRIDGRTRLMGELKAVLQKSEEMSWQTAKSNGDYIRMTKAGMTKIIEKWISSPPTPLAKSPTPIKRRRTGPSPTPQAVGTSFSNLRTTPPRSGGTTQPESVATRGEQSFISEVNGLFNLAVKGVRQGETGTLDIDGLLTEITERKIKLENFVEANVVSEAGLKKLRCVAPLLDVIADFAQVDQRTIRDIEQDILKLRRELKEKLKGHLRQLADEKIAGLENRLRSYEELEKAHKVREEQLTTKLEKANAKKKALKDQLRNMIAVETEDDA